MIHLLFGFIVSIMTCLCGSEYTLLDNRVHNCEVEIDTLKSKIHTQEEARISFEKEINRLFSQIKKAAPNPEVLLSLETRVHTITSTVATLNKSVCELKKENERQANALRELEQALRLLAASFSEGERYTVKEGDSLEKIARKHKVSVKKLREINNLHEGSVIHPGQELLINRP